jgi:CRISPR-associated protein Cas1
MAAGSKFLNISFALPGLHGKARRGELVFDIADLIKDVYVMPLAFLSA